MVSNFPAQRLGPASLQRVMILHYTCSLLRAATKRAVAKSTTFAVLAMAAAYASEPPPGNSDPAVLKKLSLDELTQLEVTSPSKEPQSAFRTPTAIYVVTGDDIRRSGVTSIPEALRLVPGVEVARIDGSKWSIGIRGLGTRLSRAVLVLIDGRTVYTTFFAGTYWEVQDTMLEDVDRIEVIRGQAAPSGGRTP